MYIPFVLVAVALHYFPGWPFWIGIVGLGVILTVPGVVRVLASGMPGRTVIALQAIGGTLFMMIICYVPIVVTTYFMGHPSW